MSRTTSVALVVLFLAGCDKVQSRPDVATAAGQSSEASWSDQIAAVRAGRSDAIRVTESDVSASQFRELRDGCEPLKTLILERLTFDRGDLSVVSRLPNLRWLKLAVRLDDDDIQSLAACRELEILNLPNGEFSNRACEVFSELTELTLLRFGSPNVTDQGIAELSRLPRLQALHLLDVPITDLALPSVASITSLESFYLDGGHVTDAALERLLLARPDLHFHRNQLHLPGDPNAHGDETAH